MSLKNKRLEKEKFRNRTEQDFLSPLLGFT